ncbi:DUF1643 domain-containing protein [Microbacterium galbinum]|uniref:DUF1643 domain-containing protein n=1 Tax=Microbacterium galbinum TaxID=2851646 RepID=UPI002D7DDBE6|nr:DUF1643 domain-containing protein [Microbacterium galbinum]
MRPDAQRLLAVLLNPPSISSGNRTLGAVRRVSDSLGCVDYEIANLFETSSPGLTALSSLELEAEMPVAIQRNVSDQLRQASIVVAAWGVSAPSKVFQQRRCRRASWVLQEARRQGHEAVWMVGGAPRHPSRWHQYVADKHGRTTGGSFTQRLSQVLEPTPIASLTGDLGFEP